MFGNIWNKNIITLIPNFGDFKIILLNTLYPNIP